MLIYFFATKTAENYNLSNPNELKNKALLTSMFSSNLGLSALLTDYLAKNMEKNMEKKIEVAASLPPEEADQPKAAISDSAGLNPVPQAEPETDISTQQQKGRRTANSRNQNG
ncbi:hypothetical protein FEDK69T_22950 [Flavobacterium enshiense DK69]|nr:hypothetical protein FEDK69T_22950 [Flavobacterium enshiense DK69]